MIRIATLVIAAGLTLPIAVHADTKPFPPPELVGTWSCTVEIFGPFKMGSYPSNAPEDTQNVVITIHTNGMVEGRIGHAVFKNASLHRNRGLIGRKLNLKTDFIVSGGTLQGKVTPKDEGTNSRFTLPFNRVEETLKGTIMLIPKFPLTCPMSLTKQKEHPEQEAEGDAATRTP